MRVGAAQTDITPQAGVELSGYVARVQPSLGVHDSLTARCLWLEDDRGGLLWVHADLIAFDRNLVEVFRSWAREHLRLPPDRVVLSATHTHSGPATIDLNGCGRYERRYVEWLLGRLQATAEAVPGGGQQAEAVFAEGACGLNVDRRGGPSAHVDRRVGVVAWRKPSGACAAVLVNYPMHNVGLSSENRLISADIAGAAARRIRAALPGEPAVLLTNGACGNLNPSCRAADFGEIEAAGAALSDSVLAALDAAEPLGDAAIRTAGRRVRLPLAPLDRAAVLDIARRFRAGLEGKSGFLPDRQRSVIDAWEQAVLRRLEQGELPRHVELSLQLVRLGEVSLVCMDAEVFSRMADELRAAAGERVYVVGYANGDIGYLPSREAFDEGGYEPDSAFLYYRGLPLDPAAFEIARDEAIEMLRADR